MKKNKKDQDLFQKIILKTYSKKELEAFMLSFQNDDVTETAMPDVTEVLKDIENEIELNDQDSNLIFEKINSLVGGKHSENETLIKSIRPLLKYVAVLLLSFASIYFYFQKTIISNVEAEQAVKSSSITLKLADGNVKIIKENENQNILTKKGETVGVQNGNTLEYTNESSIEKLIYNELTVPYGKHFDLVLSDFTKIKLNAGTTIKYPIQFITGKSREVFLKGEAFFMVSENPTQPFIVHAEDLNVKVYGTSFNVDAYPDNSFVSTVLVEGSVGLYQKEELNKVIKIKPNTKGSFNKYTKKIETVTVDTSIYTSWMKGALVFRNQSLTNIIKKLERHFNVKITQENIALNDEIFNASFHNESIAKISAYFKEGFGIELKVKENKK